MATKFSGGTYYDGTFVGTAKSDIVTALETHLTTAGWTVISGTGTTNVLMQTAADPTTGNQGRVRFKDNSGSCVQVTLENVSGSKVQTSATALTSNNGHLLPAALKTFRIQASRYRFEIFTPGASLAREFVCAGILWIPVPYQGVITEAMYLQCNANSDTDATLRASFRTSLGGMVSGGMGSSAGIVNGSGVLTRPNDSNSFTGGVQLRLPTCSYLSTYDYTAGGIFGYNNLCRWHDNALDMADPLMGWGTTLYNEEALIRGQVYDWTIISDSFAVDTTDTWTDGGGSHTWRSLTGSNVGDTTRVRGTIWVALD